MRTIRSFSVYLLISTSFLINFVALELRAQDTLGFTTYPFHYNYGSRSQLFNIPGNDTVLATWNLNTEMFLNHGSRGSGYNLYNGNSWDTLPLHRIENLMSGWSNIGVTKSGREIVVSHAIDKYLWMYWRDTVGVGVWSNKVLTTDTGGLYPTMAISGDTINVFFSSFDHDVNGVRQGVFRIYSLDNGDTWSATDTLPFSGAENALVGSDGTAIDCRGDLISLATANFNPKVLTSQDHGATWVQHRLAKVSNPTYDPYQMQDVVDTCLATSGAYAVLIDENGVTHVWHTTTVIWDTITNMQGVSGDRTIHGLSYWNSSSKRSRIIQNTIIQDSPLDLDAIRDTALFGHERAGWMSGALVDKPVAGIDEFGNMYIAYTSRNEADTSHDGNFVNDIFLISTTDGGMSWNGPINLTPGIGMESTYPSMAKLVDSFIHISYVLDEDAEANPDSNFMIHVKFPVDSINNHTSSSLSFMSSAADCNSAGGSVEVIPVGTPPFTYSWSNGDTSKKLDSVRAGWYSVAVMDSDSIILYGIGYVDDSVPGCVWPGDANNDKVVSAFDVLFIGAAVGDTGAARQNPTLNWDPQACAPWDSLFANGLDVKHADCNGDGEIDSTDISGVTVNYNKTRSKSIQQIPPADSMIYVDIEATEVYPGDSIVVKVILKDSAMQVLGAQFKLSLTTDVLDQSIAEMDHSVSMILPSNIDQILFDTLMWNDGLLDVAQVRTDGVKSTQAGELMLLILKAGQTSGKKLTVALIEARILTAAGEVIGIGGAGDNVNIVDSNLVVSSDNLSNIVVKPIPASEFIMIETDLKREVKYEIFDPIGTTVFSGQLNSNVTKVDISEWSSGVYFVRFFQEREIQTIKITKN